MSTQEQNRSAIHNLPLPRPISRSGRQSALYGKIDNISNGQIQGWAWDAQNPNKPLTVEIWDQGKKIAGATATDYREDLHIARVGNGKHAFNIPFHGQLHENILVLIAGHDAWLLPSAHKRKISAVAPQKITSEHKITGQVQGDVGERAPYEWAYFPDYTSTNPYQLLISLALPESIQSSPSTIDELLERQNEEKQKKQFIFHLHWTTPIISPASSRGDASRKKDEFLAKARAFINRGGALVWTIHNTLSHDSQFKDVEAQLCEALGDLATVIHAHSPVVVEAVSEYYHLPKRKIVYISHPNYCDVYPNYVNQAEAKQRLGIKQSDIVLGFIGQLRPYKGLEEFVEAYRKIKSRYKNVHLLIAGKPVHPFSPGMVTRMLQHDSSATVVEEHIADEALQWYFNACDYIVLPYRNVLTSGSVLNALSFHRPVIAPKMGAIPDVVTHGKNGFLYDSHDPQGLEKSLEKATVQDAASREKMREDAIASVRGLTWKLFAEKLVKTTIESITCHTCEIKINGREVEVTSSRMPGAVANQKRIAVIVLNYGHIEDSKRLINSLESSTYQDFEIFLIDNHSPKVSFQALRNIAPNDSIPFTCIRSKENLGYAAGNNIGISFAASQPFEFIWILNPDMTVEPDALSALVQEAENRRDINCFGSSIVYGHDPDRVWFAGADVDFSHGLNVSHRFNGESPKYLPRYAYTTDYITGASLFCRPHAFELAGLLPEQFFLYFEETHWCLKLRSHGQTLLMVPSSLLHHHKRSERDNLPTPYYFYYYIRNAINFTRLHSPSSLRATEQKLQHQFIGKWIEKIKKSFPSKVNEYLSLASSALLDGRSSIWGHKDLFAITFCATHKVDINSKLRPYEGYINSVSSEEVSGWVKYKNNESERVRVSIFVDQEYISTTYADQFREDLLAARKGDGKYAFKLSLPKPIADGSTHYIQIRIDHHPTKLETRIALPYSPSYKGRIDGLIGYAVRGWVYNATNLTERPDIEIVHNDEVIGTGTANIFRPDLLQAGMGDGAYGFEVRIPAKYSDGAERTMHLRLAGLSTGYLYTAAKVRSPIFETPPSNADVAQSLHWCFRYREFRFNTNEPSRLLVHFFHAQQAYAARFKNMPSQHKVSVVMPAFNRATIISTAIASVMQQAYDDIELIVVDDGSTDGTAHTVRQAAIRWKDKNIKLVELPQNRGVSHARNVGLSMSTGSIIAYLDSDNEWHPDFLQIMVNALVEDPEAQSAYCAQSIWQTIDTDKGSYAEPVMIRGGEFTLSLLENRNYIDLNCYIHKKDLFTRFGGYNESLKRLVDWDLILRYSKYNAPRFVPAILSKYYMGKAANQITKIEDYGKNFRLLRGTLQGSIDKHETLPESLSYLPSYLDIVIIVGSDSVNALTTLAKIQDIFGENAIAGRIVLSMSKDDTFLPEVRKSIAGKTNVLLHCQSPNTTIEIGKILDDLYSSKDNESDILLLSGDANIDADTLLHLCTTTALLPKAGAVVSRQLVPRSDALAIQHAPYCQGSLPVDIALRNVATIPLQNQALLRRHIFELDTLHHFCTLLPKETLLIMRFGHIKAESIEGFLRHVAEILKFTFGRPIYYNGNAKAIDFRIAQICSKTS